MSDTPLEQLFLDLSGNRARQRTDTAKPAEVEVHFIEAHPRPNAPHGAPASVLPFSSAASTGASSPHGRRAEPHGATVVALDAAHAAAPAPRQRRTAAPPPAHHHEADPARPSAPPPPPQAHRPPPAGEPAEAPPAPTEAPPPEPMFRRPPSDGPAVPEAPFPDRPAAAPAREPVLRDPVPAEPPATEALADGPPAPAPAGRAPDHPDPAAPEPAAAASDRTPHGITSPSGKRSYPRIAMPIDVEIDGRRYRAADWSLGGVGLNGDGPGMAPGDLVKMALMLDFGAYRMVLGATARAVRVVKGRALGFQFVDLPLDVARVLRMIADKWLAGDLLNPNDLLSTGPAAAPVTLSETSATVLRGLLFWLRYALYLLLAGAVITVSLLYLAASVFSVRSDYAAVAGELITVRAPEDGFYTSNPLDAGAGVSGGQTLGTIRPLTAPPAATASQARLAALEARVEQLRPALERARAGFAGYRQVAEAEEERARNARRLVEQQVVAQQRMHDRVRDLAAKGAAAPVQADAERLKLIELQRQLVEAHAAEAAARQRVNGAEQGLFNPDGRSTQRTPDELQQELREAEAEIAGLRQSMMVADNALTLPSPCDCVVSAAAVHDGEYVAKGAVLYSLTRRSDQGSALEVDVMVPFERVRLLRIGQEARVTLANSPKEQTGRISAITYSFVGTGRLGLPDALRAGGRHALVTVALPAGSAPDGAGDGPPVGMPANVTFRIAPGALFQSLTGLSWFL